MDIERFKQQHVEMLKCVHRIRQYAQAGVVENAARISHEILMLKAKVLLHLSLEDEVLYPRVAAGPHGDLAEMAKAYQREMEGIAEAFKGFVEQWGHTSAVQNDPDGFRQAANTVVKALHQRIQRENTKFYPALEALGSGVVSGFTR